uniref:Uncharacterized protein n=1 Tax=Caenorhabditis japonica TaxID=281687 RepID=A0A8R1IL28_CAEJA
MFDGIEIRGLTWPFQEIHTATSKPIGDMTLSMLRVIILLKHPRSAQNWSCSWSHCVLQDVFVHISVHGSNNSLQWTHGSVGEASPKLTCDTCEGLIVDEDFDRIRDVVGPFFSEKDRVVVLIP